MSSPPTVNMPVSTFRLVHPLVYIFVLFGRSSLYLSASYPVMPHPFGWLQPVQDLAFLLMRNQTVMSVVFIIAISLHVGEAAYVLLVLLDRKAVAGWDRLWWTMQTLAVGYPSLRLLRRLPDVRSRRRGNS
jgi:hypothetical protein